MERSGRGTSKAVLATAGACLLIVVIGVALWASSNRHPSSPAGRSAAPRSTAASVPSTPHLEHLVAAAPCGFAAEPSAVGRPGGPHLAGAAEVARFDATAVIQCTAISKAYPGEGLWQVLVRRVNTTDVAALKTVLTRPDGPEPPPGSACASVGYSPLPILLVDASGHYLHPRAPEEGCGAPQPIVTSTLARLRWRTVSVTKVRQLESPGALASGCSQQYKNMLRVLTEIQEPTPADNAGTPVLARLAGQPLRACLYRTSADSEASTFDRAVTLTVHDAAEALTALAGAGPTRACPAQPEFALIGDRLGRDVAVELGGCWRVLRNDTQPLTLGTADPTALRRLLGLR